MKIDLDIPLEGKHLLYANLYMDIATRCSLMSYARNRKVGCIAVKDGAIIGQGWNGMPAGFDNECEQKKSILDGEIPVTSSLVYNDHLGQYYYQTNPQVLHAEENLILKIARNTTSLEGATLYTTLAPCINCSSKLLAVGIKEVFYGDSYRDFSGLTYLRNNGIKCQKL
jgi:dCMP deaminase